MAMASSSYHHGRVNRIIIGASIWLTYLCAGTDHTSVKEVVLDTPNGRLAGLEESTLGETVHSYLGVPFAEPPVGKRRYKPPVKKNRWRHTLAAKTLTRACYQGKDTYYKGHWGAEMWNANTVVDEDCLYMNIWVPATAASKGELLPVLVWIFGGGYWYGSPSLALYNGRALAVTGNAIVVNINYRVGAFGFLYLDHPDAPGNMGMLDQQLALRWVRDQIQAFGGDPQKVCLFGESAGAASVVAHMIAPGSHGLFHSGIMQSGSLDNKWSLDTPAHAMAKSWTLVELNDCNKTTKVTEEVIECMRQVEPKKLADDLWQLTLGTLEFPLVIVSQDRNFFSAGDALSNLRSGNYASEVNLIIGINKDEGHFWNLYYLDGWFSQQPPTVDATKFVEHIDSAFSAQPLIARRAAAYVYGDRFCDNKPNFYVDQLNQMVGDYFFTCDSLWLADQMAERGPGRVYVYYFVQRSSTNPWPKWTGVMHGYEIEYVFGVPLTNHSSPYTTAEKTLSETIMLYWSQFAKDGSLNGMKRLSTWPQYTTSNKRWLMLHGDDLTAMDPIKQEECDIWRNAQDIEYKLKVKIAQPQRVSFGQSVLKVQIATKMAILVLVFIAVLV